MRTIFFIIYIFYINIPFFSNIISIPFKFNYKNYYLFYNSTNFLEEYFKKELLLEFSIGSPPQKINTLLDINSPCFIFKNIKSKNDIHKFSPTKSSSYNIHYKSDIHKKQYNSSDIFKFKDIQGKYNYYNLTFLLEINNITESINETFIPIIGLQAPIIYLGNNIFSCPNFVYITIF